MVVYMQVTKDEYELPLMVCDSVPELSRKCGVKSTAIHTALSSYKSGERKNTSFRRVEFDESEE